MAARPKILLASWLRWPSVARLAGALIAAGAEVEVVCPFLHPMLLLRGLGRRYRYSVARPLDSLARAIASSSADLVIPCDDIVIGQLVELADRAATRTRDIDDRIVAAVDRVLGSAETRSILTARARLISFALEAGISAPPTEVVTSKDEIAHWLTRHGAPAFLKADGSFGGDGVREIASADHASAAFDELSSGPPLIESMKQAIKEQSFAKLRLRLGPARPVVNIQKAVVGVEANCSFSCWRGQLVSVVAVKVQKTVRAKGPASHVTTLENDQMQSAAETIARRLGLSGIFGLDFIIEAGSGRPILLEMNARPTQIAHFRLGPGRDPVEALVAAMDGRAARSPRTSVNEATIALFPQILSGPRPSPSDSGVIDDLPLDQSRLVLAYTPWPVRVRDFLSAFRWRVPARTMDPGFGTEAQDGLRPADAADLFSAERSFPKQEDQARSG